MKSMTFVEFTVNIIDNRQVLYGFRVGGLRLCGKLDFIRFYKDFIIVKTLPQNHIYVLVFHPFWDLFAKVTPES